MSDRQLFPQMSLIRQDLFRTQEMDITSRLQETLHGAVHNRQIPSGGSVAVAVGSRGIQNMDMIVRETIRFLLHSGLHPIIVPAMGSHGGGTPEAQASLLESFGISEASMGVPVLSSMNVTEMGSIGNKTRIFFSTDALSCDHIVVINRIKPHTKFRSAIESGLCKMLVVGLGKKTGAAEIHQKAIHHSFTIIEEAAAHILKSCNILCGIGIIEDGYGRIAHIEAMSPEILIHREKELLQKANQYLARIPFQQIDILIIDHIGKDISGIGMDSNVTGRHRDITGDFQISPHVKRIFVRDLSPLSDGNGNGIGLADFTTKRLVDAMDLEKTYINAMTAVSPEKAAIPMYFDSDLPALEACMKTCGAKSVDSARIVRIQNTKNLEYLQISKALKKETEKQTKIHFATPWQPIRFTANGNLTDFQSLLP
ncbi:MAG: DUF362 domain-containing protein [Desulfobacteraceae bacterium]|nr:MAG: DUF362 domain-containing protein [Desulfobacteraceae bacterium]